MTDAEVAARVAKPRAEAQRLRHVIDLIVDNLLAAALAGEVAIIFVATISRAFFNHPFLWTQESAHLALSTMAFLGGAVAYRQEQALSVQAIVRLLPERGRLIARATSDSIILLLSLLIAVYGYDAAVRDWGVLTTDARLPVGLFYIPLVVGSALLAFYAADKLLRQGKLALLISAVLLAVCAIGIFTKPEWEDWSLNQGLGWSHYFWVSFILMGVLFAIGLPIPFVLLVVPLVYFHFSLQVPTLFVAQQMIDGTSSFLLLAIPFFVYAGLVMAEGGLGHRIADVVKLFTRRMSGGLLHSVIAFMYVFSGLSGSKVADMAAVGMTMGPELDREGHRHEETTAVLAASAVMGESIPPSIGLIVLGSVTSLSIGGLFLAGLLPAAILAVLIGLIVVVRNRGKRVPVLEPLTWRTRGKAVVRAIPALTFPVILVYGIVGGIGTPTEVSSFAVIYGVLAAVMYREVDVRDIWRMCREAAVLAGMIVFIISTAAAFSWYLNVEGFPATLAKILDEDLGGRPWAFILASFVILTVMGSFLEGLAAVIIFAPLLMPIAIGVGIDPLQYGIMLVLAMNLGFFTPPVGIGAYVACAIGQTTVEKFVRPFAPYWIVLCLGIIALGFWAWPSTFLPELFDLR